MEEERSAETARREQTVAMLRPRQRLPPPRRRRRRISFYAPSFSALLVAVAVRAAVFAVLVAGQSNDPDDDPSSASVAASSCYPNSLKIDGEHVSHRSPKLVVAHRGASFHLPEHTLAAYRLALELGADFVEPDLVATKDGKLIAIHTCDLSVTTDVESKFPADRAWHSPYNNRTGFWSFNFTLEEIQTNLTVKQRVGPARSKLYDHRWTVPSLDELLRVLNKWNTVDLPYIMGYNKTSGSLDGQLKKGNHPTKVQLAQSGLYAELKDYEWLKQDAELDLVELLFQHFDEHSDLWEPLQHCYTNVPYDQYKVPSLVVQSFDAAGMQAFHEKWATSSQAAKWPEPPYILLTKFPLCTEDGFWFEIGKNYRDFLGGIGCEKTCLLDEVEGRAFLSKVEEFDLQVHAWTERPEAEYLKPGQADVVAETQHLFCERNAGAVFSESVSTAVMVASWPCPDDKKMAGSNVTIPSAAGGGEGGAMPPEQPEGGDGSNIDDGQSTPGTGTSSSNSPYCYESAKQANLYVGIASFIVGGFVTGLLMFCLSGRRRGGAGSGGASRRTSSNYHHPARSDLDFQVEMT